MVKHKFDYELIVIGSGAAGAVAAEIIARSGRRVAIIENGELGGQAPTVADVPSQALLTAAHLYDEARKGAAFGIRSQTLGYNYPSVKAWKDLAVKRSGVASSESYYRSRGISVFHGAAHFISPNEITVNRRHLSAENFLIATGSKWQIPGIVGLDKIDYLTPDTAIDLIRPPKSLFVVGAGAAGCEFAELFSIFGSKVYLADAKKRILPREDDETSALVNEVFAKQRGMEILTGTRVLKVAKDGPALRVTYLRGGNEFTVKVEKILLAAGRLPVVDLGLENAHVKYSDAGVETNEFMQTSARQIYAAGDVTGPHFAQTHVAILQSRVAANNILRRNKQTPDYRAIPRVTYLSPEVASVGLTETDCLKQDIKMKRVVVPSTMISRANTSNQRNGLVKVMADARGVLIGATVIAPSAGQTIHELTLAIQYGMTAAQVADAVHAFGTWSEAVRIACAKLR